ncbi:hypothetical protein HYFRA_00004010 [Hymenoscyphus fraxineus]|uniref:Uncharacterized protein n=1 Tax=Hymenoscyphus fraxineus TaxID=746836 RepID=A0A9N9KQD1_9HELO|nr:hypothetical protein HYFRA_00004010 [Hymenoscyphus fraxineus]
MYFRFYLSSREGDGRPMISRDIVVMRKFLQDNEDLEPFKQGPLVQFITKLAVHVLELKIFDSGWVRALSQPVLICCWVPSSAVDTHPQSHFMYSYAPKWPTKNIPRTPGAPAYKPNTAGAKEQGFMGLQRIVLKSP